MQLEASNSLCQLNMVMILVTRAFTESSWSCNGNRMSHVRLLRHGMFIALSFKTLPEPCTSNSDGVGLHLCCVLGPGWCADHQHIECWSGVQAAVMQPSHISL
jgi:hypothetical protein